MFIMKEVLALMWSSGQVFGNLSSALSALSSKKLEKLEVESMGRAKAMGKMNYCIDHENVIHFI